MIDNTITVSGNVTRPPEMKYTPSGTAMTVLGLAVNRRWKDAAGADQEQVSFFDVVCWQQLADNACETLDKGHRITVTGRLEQRSWETDDGEKRSKVEIVADDVAVSLKWATAEVKRNEKRGGGRDDGPPRQEPSGGRPAQTVSGQAYDDQEPF